MLLAPEHGVRGDKGAGENFENAVDGPSGLLVTSLYGKEASHHLSEEACAAFDILVYDIQDVGARCYTFISTLQISAGGLRPVRQTADRAGSPQSLGRYGGGHAAAARYAQLCRLL